MLNYLFTSYAYVLPPILGFIVLFPLSLISLLRGRKSPTNILFAGLCFLGAIINADVALVSLIADKQLALKIDRITYFFFVFSLPIFIQFVHAFAGIGRRAWIEYLAYFFSLFFLFFTPSSLFISGLNTYGFGTIAKAGPVYHAFAAAAGLTVCYCFITLFSAMKRARENELKNRIKYILGGVGLSIILLILNILPVLGFAVYPPGNFSFVPAIFLAYGVLKYDLLDIGAVIRRGTIYFILTTLLTFLYIVIIYIFNTFLALPGQNTVVLPLLLALFMVLIFNPLKERVRKFIDNLFFRGRYDYQQFLKKISGEIASLLKKHQIRELLLRSISSALQVSRVCLFLYDRDAGCFLLYQDGEGRTGSAGQALLDRTHPLVCLLEESGAPLSRIAVEHLGSRYEKREQLIQFFNDFGANMVIPLLSRKRLLGMIALGEKKSGELLVHEDIELLTTIANQAVTAIENAHAYEEIEKLNLELERKVAQRTASLRSTLEEKEKTQKQLIQSESLAAIGQLVAGAAHELNNPLAGASSLIQSSLEAISKGKAKSDEVVDDLKFSLKELRRMGEIVRSLLDLSRKTQVYAEPVLVNVAIDDALRILYNQYKYLRVEIEKEYDENLPVIEGNYANLGQVFINVIKNSLQSLPNGAGKITLRTSCDRERDRVLVECRDTGKGIPARHQKDIFKPFFTTKGVGEGTGLGLYVSHEIVKRHGGSIDVTSEEGSGTSLIIELPCHRGEP
jgi:two-component system NtrC family sensor kinase